MPEPDYPWRRPYAPPADPSTPISLDGTPRGPQFAPPPAPAAAPAPRRPRRRLIVVAVVVLLVIAAGVAGGWLVWRRYHPSEQVSAAIRSADVLPSTGTSAAVTPGRAAPQSSPGRASAEIVIRSNGVRW